MQFKSFLAAAATAAVASAQSAPSLAAAVNSTQELSMLNSLLGQYPQLLSTLSNATNITVFAPSNNALSALTSNPTLQAAAAMPGYIQALLQYHVANGTVYSQNISSTPTFVHTLLTNETYSNVTGGQVVGARTVSNNGSVAIISGEGARSNVSRADIAISNGVVHIIDSVLTLPVNASATLQAANLTALAGALRATNLTTTIDDARDITIFAPTNMAFGDIASALANLTTEQARSILEYHVLNGTVAYSNLISNGSSVETAAGSRVNITVEDGEVFVNSARVIAADILISGGVVHVIDSVLNPNSTLRANPDEDSPVVAYSGASSGAVPYTSGIAAPTSTLITTTDAVASGYTAAPSNALSSASRSAAEQASSSSHGGAAMATGHMAAAALFGGAAFFL